MGFKGAGTWAQTPLLEASGSTPMLAHMAWNCALKAGSFRMSSLHDRAAHAKGDEHCIAWHAGISLP